MTGVAGLSKTGCTRSGNLPRVQNELPAVARLLPRKRTSPGNELHQSHRILSLGRSRPVPLRPS